MTTQESSISAAAGAAAARNCAAYLAQHGLLMKADSKLPSVTTMIAGEPIRGSWWAHPQAHTIFFALRDLESHPDLLLVKLVAGKDTLAHRKLWPEVVSIALAQEPWQTRNLPPDAAALLKKINISGEIESAGPAARLLESRLLVRGIQVHSHDGHHRKRLKTWQRWAARAGQSLDDLPASNQAKLTLEEIWPAAKWPWPKRKN
jgi:hypothetical protein